MRATGTIKIKPAGTQVAGDLPRALWAGGIMVGVCGLAAVVALFVHTTSPNMAQRPSYSPGDLATGSMLMVSPNGTQCAQGTIDNSTWQIRNQGWTDCDEAIARAATAGVDYRPTGGTRLNMIRDSFRGSTAAGAK
jgi:hypothetical protein